MFFSRGVVEWPQTAGFEPVNAGSNPAAPATVFQFRSSEAERRSYKAKVGISTFPGTTNPAAIAQPDQSAAVRRPRPVVRIHLAAPTSFTP